MVEIYTFNIIDNITEAVFIELLPLVSKEKQAEIKRLAKREDAWRSLFSGLLLRAAVCEKLCVKKDDIVIVKNRYGKPFLGSVDNPPLHFNLSHSGQWVVCAVDQMPVGIDIEQVRPVDLDIARRFFSETEYQELFSKSGEDRVSYFYDLWTSKESFVKAKGKGLSIPLDSFSISITPCGGISIKSEHRYKKVYFKQYNISQCYSLSVCAHTGTFPVYVRNVGLEYILRCLKI